MSSAACSPVVTDRTYSSPSSRASSSSPNSALPLCGALFRLRVKFSGIDSLFQKGALRLRLEQIGASHFAALQQQIDFLLKSASFAERIAAAGFRANETA